MTITPEPVDFEVTASRTTLNYNDTVTVTVTVSPAQVGGLNVPWTIDSTTWVPAFGTQGPPCVAWAHFDWVDPGTRTCRKPFTRSGTLTVFATVNGVKAQKALAITVTPPKLTVTASPANIAGPQAVTFTASVTPSSVTWNTTTWGWTPDSGTGGISPGVCGWDQKTCTRTVSRSGWKKATVVVGEYTLSDSAHVRIIPCPTNRVPLDEPAVRQALKDAYTQSVAGNQERVVAVFHEPGLGYFVQPVPTSYASQCKATWTPPHPSSFPGADLVAIAHTHPYKPNTNQSCPEFGNYIGRQGGSTARSERVR